MGDIARSTYEAAEHVPHGGVRVRIGSTVRAPDDSSRKGGAIIAPGTLPSDHLPSGTATRLT